MKTSCCPNSYLGIPEESFKEGIANNTIRNNDLFPCVSCKTLYIITNYSLVKVRDLSLKEVNFILKSTTETLFSALFPKKEVKGVAYSSDRTEEEELKTIQEEFKDLKLN